MERSQVLKCLLCIIAVLLFSSYDGKAQRFAVHTDAFQYLTLSPNLGFEVAVNQHNSLQFSASVAPFKVADNLTLKHITLSPEYKHWFTMPFFGHYAGASLLYSSYDISIGNFVRNGNLLAACADYGYSLILGRRWNLVPHAGLGLGVDLGQQTKFVPLVAKVGINIQLVVR